MPGLNYATFAYDCDLYSGLISHFAERKSTVINPTPSIAAAVASGQTSIPSLPGIFFVLTKF